MFFLKKKIDGGELGQGLVAVFDRRAVNSLEENKWFYDNRDEEFRTKMAGGVRGHEIELTEPEFKQYRIFYILSLGELMLMSITDKNARKIYQGLFTSVQEFALKYELEGTVEGAVSIIKTVINENSHFRNTSELIDYANIDYEGGHYKTSVSTCLLMSAITQYLGEEDAAIFGQGSCIANLTTEFTLAFKEGGDLYKSFRVT